MKQKMPWSPFATRLSGSAKETELRIRNIFQWKKKRPPVILLLAAILLVIGCGSVIGFTREDTTAEDDEILDFSPQEEESENTPPAAPVMTDSQAVLDYVDAVFASGDPTLQCFLLPATGPISAPMDEYYEEVRDLFAQYTWVRQDGPMPKRDPYPDGWTMYLKGGYSITIDIRPNSPWITVMTTGEEGPQWIACSAEGGTSDLGLSLVNLWDGPLFRYALVTLPKSITDDGALAEAYADAFRELYLNSGAITDYELRDLEDLPRDGEWDVYPSFRMTYSVRPADPEDPSWQYCPQAEDGWVTVSAEIHLDLAGDDFAEEMVWRCSWFE